MFHMSISDGSPPSPYVPMARLKKCPTGMLLSMTRMDQLALSPIRSHEIPAVMRLHAALLPISYPRSFFLHLLLQPTRLCLVARNDSDPVAFISAAMHPGQRLEILTLGVLPPFQQHRLATRLVHAAIEALASKAAATIVFAQVSASNESAREFYRHMGMLPDGNIIHDMYRTLPCGYRDAYIISGRIETRARNVVSRNEGGGPVLEI
ncbi:acyl-CoA N-acyltransferase [Mycena galopus ATCC 62051]|nr:acyl-CoA N-acyltransferase [Mycena galopus ATCC 62051]